MSDCPFCDRIERGEYDTTAYATVVRFEPLNPVTPGHMLFVPIECVYNAAESPEVTGDVFAAASDYAQDQGGDNFNLITSAGVSATQSVWHLHVHYVPRRQGDGLCLPWTNQGCDEPTIRVVTADECICRNDHPHLDEFIARNMTVHFEQMDDAQFWIGITDAYGNGWSINCGAVNSRAKGYAICEPLRPGLELDGEKP